MKYLYLGLLILCLLLCACYLSSRQVQARIEAAALPLHRAMNAHRAGDGAARELAVRESLDRWRSRTRWRNCKRRTKHPSSASVIGRSPSLRSFPDSMPCAGRTCFRILRR